MQSADFLSAVFFYLKVGENLNQNWIVENLNNAFSTWNGKLGELWGLVTTGPQTFKGGAVWSVMQTLHNGMVGIGYALVVLFFAICRAAAAADLVRRDVGPQGMPAPAGGRPGLVVHDRYHGRFG